MIVSAVSVVLLASGAVAGDTLPTPSPPQWSVEWRYSHEFSERGVREGLQAVELGRRLGRAGIAAEVVRVREADRWHPGGGVTVHAPLWRHAEGAFRLAAVPDALSVPVLMGGVDMTQHVGGRWDATAGASLREYRHGEVLLTRLGLGLTSGAWRISGGVGLAGAAGDDPAPTAHGILRRRLGPHGSIFEIHAATGREILDFLPTIGGVETLQNDSWSAGGRALIRLGRTAAVGFLGGYQSLGEFGGRAQLEGSLRLMW